ncbi:MAG: c-type cytochrome [Gammaproteobacteria bacterium]
MSDTRRNSRIRFVGAAMVLFAGAISTLTPGLAYGGEMEEYAIGARRGYFSLVGWHFGPLGAMAKGEMAYDAGAASAHAQNLKWLTGYDVLPLFVPGTTKEAYKGKTRALPKLWDELDDAKANYEDFKTELGKLAEVAGNGSEALAAQVKVVGKTCGGCHKPYRAKKF